jgi:S1-C subfamily serine protease
MASFIDLSRSLADAVEKAGSYTVMVTARKGRPASGVAWRDGLVLTASHAVEADEGITVTLPGGQSTGAGLAGRDQARDIAVLRLDAGAASPAAQAAGGEPRVGQLALSVGRLPMDGINAALGIVSAAGERLSLWRGSVIDRYLQTDAPRAPGFSGGPLADADGRMLGINVFGRRFGASLAIPTASAFQTAERILKGGTIRRGYLGVRSQPVELPLAVREALRGRQTTGLLLVGVEPGSPAEGAGLMVGDILVGFKGAAVRGHEELLELLGSDAAGAEARAEIVRGGSLTAAAIIVGAAS